MGVQQLTGVQLVPEAAVGTTLPATSVLAGVTAARHREVPTIIRPPEYRGLMARDFRSKVVGRHGEIHLEGYANVADMNHLLEMTFRGGVSPTSDAGTPAPAHTRVYIPQLTIPDVPKTYSIEMGDDTQYYVYNGAFGSAFTLAGARDDVVRFTWDGMSKFQTETAKTPALAQHTVEPISANEVILYLDSATGGTIGDTAFAGCLLGFNARFPGFEMFKCMDGTLFYTRIVQPPLAATLEITALFDDTTAALLNSAYRTAARQLLRLEMLGPQLHATPTPTFERLTVDFAGVIADCSEIGGSQEQGQNTLRLRFDSEYDDASALLWSIETVSALATLT